jgi:hypothetical protein
MDANDQQRAVAIEKNSDNIRIILSKKWKIDFSIIQRGRSVAFKYSILIS